ncbi:MAG TPA: hypothetical protein EYN67_20930 [Flavobacteriales bacterium]|nr:hypothetical protein [Flavobacteriales bacterium]HHZ97946.1 hypothetical protein [Flavobacteriales bacterium]
MSNIYKEYKFIDLNAFSGSSENFRTANGGYWSIISGTTSGENIDFTVFNPGADGSTAGNQNNSTLATEGFQAFIHQITANIGIDREYVTAISADKILPNYRFPVRIIGKEANIESGAQWKALIMGGVYAGETYAPLYQTNTFDDNTFFYNMPYSTMEANTLSSSPLEVDISPVYNYYVQQYEDYINSDASENLLPDYYVFRSYWINRWDGISALDQYVDEDIEEWITLGNSYDATAPTSTGYSAVKWFEETYLDTLPPYQVLDSANYIVNTQSDTTQYLHKTLYMREYLTSSYLSYTPDPSLISDVQTKLTNVFFNATATRALLGGSPNLTAFPYYIKINFTRGEPIVTDTSLDWGQNPGQGVGAQGASGVILDTLWKHGYDSTFLNILKDAFTGQGTLIPESIGFVSAVNYYSGSYRVNEAEGTALRSVDMFDMLAHRYNNYITPSQNGYFVGDSAETSNSSTSPASLLDQMALDSDGRYKYNNSMATLGVLSNLRYFIGAYDEGTYNTPNTIYDLFDVDGNFRSVSEELPVSGSDTNASPSVTKFYGGDAIDKLYNLGGESNYHETLVYRIEKKGANGKTIQNNWILAARPVDVHDELRDLESFEFCDTQLKYGESYTYDLYAYVAVITGKYNFSDLVLTRPLGFADESTGLDCIEWYNPATEETATPLAFKMTAFEYADSSVENTLATSAQDVSSNTYQADFYVNYENTMKIIEVPITSKTIRILDNPPTSLDILPYQMIDDSQRIGFCLKDDSFVPTPYPSAIETTDSLLKKDYLNSSNLTPTDNIILDSITNSRYIQIFRLDEKPEKFADFDGHEIALIDLAIPDSVHVYSTHHFVEKIAANKKYYYLFRALNEHREPGYVYEIYEAELISDGGYKYAKFNSLYETDLAKDIYKDPSRPAKNLLQLRPAYSQLALNFASADFDGTAYDELSNVGVGIDDYTIWGKTFKVRLTSRKTGKKIDLNITYDYEDAL